MRGHNVADGDLWDEAIKWTVTKVMNAATLFVWSQPAAAAAVQPHWDANLSATRKHIWSYEARNISQCARTESWLSSLGQTSSGRDSSSVAQCCLEVEGAGGGPCYVGFIWARWAQPLSVVMTRQPPGQDQDTLQRAQIGPTDKQHLVIQSSSTPFEMVLIFRNFSARNTYFWFDRISYLFDYCLRVRNKLVMTKRGILTDLIPCLPCFCYHCPHHSPICHWWPPGPRTRPGCRRAAPGPPSASSWAHCCSRAACPSSPRHQTSEPTWNSEPGEAGTNSFIWTRSNVSLFYLDIIKHFETYIEGWDQRS